MTVENQAPTCTYNVGGHLEGQRPCGVAAAARCDFGDTENYPEYVYYCVRHFNIAYEYIARDENRLATVGQYSGRAPTEILN